MINMLKKKKSYLLPLLCCSVAALLTVSVSIYGHSDKEAYIDEITQAEDAVYTAIGQMHVLSMIPEDSLSNVDIELSRQQINDCMIDLLSVLDQSDFKNEKLKPCLNH